MDTSVVLRIENDEPIVGLRPLMSWAGVAVRLFEDSSLEEEGDGPIVAARIGDAWRPLCVAIDPGSARRVYDVSELASSRRSLVALAASVSCALDNAGRAGVASAYFETVFRGAPGCAASGSR